MLKGTQPVSCKSKNLKPGSLTLKPIFLISTYKKIMARQPSECSDKGKSEATEGLTGTIGLTGSPTLYIVKRDYLEAGKNRKVKGT